MGKDSKLLALIASKKYMLFDMDGTLVDLEQLNFTSFAKAAEVQLGLTLTYDEYFTYFSGSGSNKGFERYVAAKKIEHPDVPQLVKQYRDNKRHALAQNFDKVVTMKPGVVAFLEYCKKQNKRLAIGTSTGKEFAYEILEHCKLLPYFEKIITIEDVMKTKPDPEIFLKTLESLQGTKADAVIFEDSRNGTRAARNAGIDCVVIHTYGQNDMLSAQSKYMIESYEELIP